MADITVQALQKNVTIVTAFTEGYLKKLNCPQKVLSQLAIVIDEIFSNIVKYSYVQNTGFVIVRIDYQLKEHMIRLQFEDSGVAYNPLKAEEPDITLPAEEREIGGLGLLLVKKLIDRSEYIYLDGRNILTLYKSMEA